MVFSRTPKHPNFSSNIPIFYPIDPRFDPKGTHILIFFLSHGKNAKARTTLPPKTNATHTFPPPIKNPQRKPANAGFFGFSFLSFSASSFSSRVTASPPVHLLLSSSSSPQTQATHPFSEKGTPYSKILDPPLAMPRVLFGKYLHQCRFHIHEAPHPPFLPRRSTPMLAVRIVGLLAGSGNLDICKKTSYLNVDSNSRTHIGRVRSTVAGADLRVRMERNQRVRKAEELVKKAMKGNDASHDAAHVWRVRDLALSFASEEGFSSDPHFMEIVELAALLHDIGDYKYLRDPSEEKTVENFLEEEGVDENKKSKILKIIKGMGFKEEVTGNRNSEWFPELEIVQDADRLDAIGAIGIARCFTFGGSKKMVLHDPSILPRSDLSKEQYMNKEEQTTINHFHEKLLKLKDMMKTKAGQRRAERRHKFMEEFVKEFYDEWNGLS